MGFLWGAVGVGDIFPVGVVGEDLEQFVCLGWVDLTAMEEFVQFFDVHIGCFHFFTSKLGVGDVCVCFGFTPFITIRLDKGGYR